METTYFDQFQVKFDIVKHLGFILYKFSIFDQITGSRYSDAEIYLTEAKACLSAYFQCLRASLDNDPHPALLVHLETGTILSINLAAFELLLIDASGANISDFIMDLKDYQQADFQLWQSEKLRQPTSLCNADGLLMKCEIEVQNVPYYPKWAVFYFKTIQSQPCFPQLSH